MKISVGTVVTYTFLLRDDAGKLVERTKEAPSEYVHGRHEMMPDIEKALEGKGVGDTVSVQIPPEKAYGPVDEELIRTLPKSRFAPDAELNPGMTVVSEKNAKFPMKVLAVTEETVTLDANHPLAGKTLFFDIEVKGVRKALPDELTHPAVPNEMQVK